MNDYIVLTKLVHEKNTDKANKEIHSQITKANSFGEAEMITKTNWAKMQCDAEIIQITKNMENSNDVQNTTNVGNEVLADISSRFLSAKFGKNMVLNFDGYEDSQYEGRRVGGKLQELLDEFAQIVTAVELVELQNPRTKQFTLVDKNKGTIIGSYDKSFLNGC